ncbi:MAG: sigma factor [Terracidiphilus sp.]
MWIKTFRGIRKLKDPGSLRSWLYSITHGIAIDGIRKRSSCRSLSFSFNAEWRQTVLILTWTADRLALCSRPGVWMRR